MAKYLEFKTTAGSYIVNAGDLVLVQLKDGKYVEIPAAKAVKYANESKIAVKRKNINVSFTDLENILLQSTGGEASQYRRARDRLYEQNENGLYETKLSRVLKRAHGEKVNKDSFLDRLYEVMRDYALKNGFETVTRSQLDSWYSGKEIAPRDWRNFKGMLQLKNEFPALAEFEQFILDKENYQPDTKRSVDENLYQAYLFYVCTNRFLGRKAETKFKYDPQNLTKKQSNSGGQRKVDLEEVKRAIYRVFYEDIDEDFCAVSLIDAKDVENINDNLSNGVYVVRKECKKPNVNMKPIEEIVKEVAILESVLLNNVNSFIYDELKSNLLGLEKRFDFYKYISYLIEERIRHNQIEKLHLFMNEDEIKKCKKAADLIYKNIFESQKANKHMKLKDNSFQRLKATYDTLTPLYPKVMEDAVNLISNVEKLTAFLRICKEVKEKKIKNLNGEYSLSKKQERKIKEKINEYLSRFEKIKDKAEELRSKYNLKPILSQLVADYVYFLKDNDQKTSTEFNRTIGSLITDKNNKPIYYTEEDFKQVLTKYDLDEFIENDPDINLIKKLENVFNNINPFSLITKSPVIFPNTNS